MMDDDACSAVSYLKEGLDIASVCESGAVFEVSDLASNFEDIESCHSGYDEDMIQKFASELCLSNKDERVELLDSFENLAKDFEGVTDDNLVMKQVVKQGTGSIVPPSSSVIVHYNAYLEYADEPFDSSRLRKQAYRFDLGNCTTIEGFEVAVSSMKKKEISKFLICPEYAFGLKGCPPRIPENTTCLYIIELIDFTAIGEDNEDYFHLPMSERKYAPFDVMMKAFKIVRNKAKHLFNGNKFLASSKTFSQALSMLEHHGLKDEEEERLLKPELIKLHTNLALCHLKLLQSARTISHCNEIFRLDGNNIKAFYFKGKALRQVGDFNSAKKCLEKADKLKPGKKEIQVELAKVEKYSVIFADLFGPDMGISRNPEKFPPPTKVINETDEHLSKVLATKLDVFLKEDNIMELQLQQDQITDKQLSLLVKLAAEKDLLFKSLKDSGGNPVIHVQKRHFK